MKSFRINSNIFGRIGISLLLLTLIALVLYPYIWMFMTSFKFEADIVTFPPRLFANRFTFDAYWNIWERIPFLLFYRNTFIFAGGVTLLSLFFDCMAGYAFARLRFRWRNAFFVMVLVTLMIPFQVIMIPLFAQLFHMGLINTWAGLLLPRATNGFGIFMMRQFFVTLPKGLEEAARIDGCSEFTIYWRIMLPLCKPAVLSLGIFHFMFNWNDLLYPLILTTTNDMRTLPAGLALFMGAHVREYAVIMAGGVLSLIPLLLAFIFAQKYFIKGIAMTGLKG